MDPWDGPASAGSSLFRERGVWFLFFSLAYLFPCLFEALDVSFSSCCFTGVALFELSGISPLPLVDAVLWDRAMGAPFRPHTSYDRAEQHFPSVPLLPPPLLTLFTSP